MVSELIRNSWCDVCRAEGSNQAAAYESPIAIDDGPPLQVDLCTMHEAEYLAPLRQLLAAHGREPDAVAAAKPRRGRPPKTAADGPQYKYGLAECVVCGQELQRQNMGRHMRQVHKSTTVIGRPLAAGEVACPECGQVFNRPASLGVHRKLKHGVAGSSKATVGKLAKLNGQPSDVQLSLVDGEAP